MSDTPKSTDISNDDQSLAHKPANDVFHALPETAQSPSRAQQTLAVIESLKGASKDQIETIVRGTERIIRATNPELARIELRKQAMQGLLLLALFCVAGTVVAALFGRSSAWLPMLLVILGTVCTGAAAALGSGQAVKLAEFSEAIEKLVEMIYSLTRISRKDDEK
jgi:hypothetical protein